MKNFKGPRFCGPAAQATRPGVAIAASGWLSFPRPFHTHAQARQTMKANKILPILSLTLVCLTEPAYAPPQAQTYQMTGVVTEVTDATITIQKGADKFQLARDKGTKIKGDLKVGAKVTIQYRYVAIDVDVKAEKPEKRSE